MALISISRCNRHYFMVLYLKFQTNVLFCLTQIECTLGLFTFLTFYSTIYFVNILLWLSLRRFHRVFAHKKCFAYFRVSIEINIYLIKNYILIYMKTLKSWFSDGPATVNFICPACRDASITLYLSYLQRVMSWWWCLYEFTNRTMQFYQEQHFLIARRMNPWVF